MWNACFNNQKSTTKRIFYEVNYYSVCSLLNKYINIDKTSLFQKVRERVEQIHRIRLLFHGVHILILIHFVSKVIINNGFKIVGKGSKCF